MSQINYYAAEGLQKLKNELYNMKTVQRPSISEQIAEARDKGDLSENAEYDAAKEAQGLLEMKISKFENIIANARLIDETRTKLPVKGASIIWPFPMYRPTWRIDRYSVKSLAKKTMSPGRILAKEIFFPAAY